MRQKKIMWGMTMLKTKEDNDEDDDIKEDRDEDNNAEDKMKEDKVEDNNIKKEVGNNIKKNNFKKNKEKDKNVTVDEVEENDITKYKIKDIIILRIMI